MAEVSGLGTSGPERVGDIPRLRGRSGARPSHEEMSAHMGLQGSEYWALWDIARGALLRSTLDYNKWRLVSECEKAESGRALYNDSRLGDKQRAVLDTPWVLDYFLKTRWNIDRSNRRYARNSQHPPASRASDTSVRAAVAEGLASSSSAPPPILPLTTHHEVDTANRSHQNPGSDADNSPSTELSYPLHTSGPEGNREVGTEGRRGGIDWMLNPFYTDDDDYE